jgi:hypothetical protein
VLGLSRPRRRHGELRHVGAGGVTGQPWAREPSGTGGGFRGEEAKNHYEKSGFKYFK